MMSLSCPSCRRDLPSDAVFCGFCGAPIEAAPDHVDLALTESAPPETSAAGPPGHLMRWLVVAFLVAGIGGGTVYLLSGDRGDGPATTVEVATTAFGQAASVPTIPTTTAAPDTTTPPATTEAVATTRSPEAQQASDIASIVEIWTILDESLRRGDNEHTAGVLYESSFMETSPEECRWITENGLVGAAPIEGSIVPDPEWQPPPEYGVVTEGRVYRLEVELSYDDGRSLTDAVHTAVIDHPGGSFAAWFWPCFSVEERDAQDIIEIWDGFNAAWQAGYQSAARFVSDHAFPGVPADYGDCLEVYGAADSALRIEIDPATIRRDDDWNPGFGITPEGRNYVMAAVTFFDGVRTSEIGVRVAILDGAAYLFDSCIPDQ